MAIQVAGKTVSNVAEVESNNALRTCVYPIDPSTLGHYKLAAFSGLTTGMGANAPVFSFRWGDASRLCTIERLRVTATVVTGFTAAQEIALDAVIARAFTVADTSGTAITPTGSVNKARTSYGTTLVSDVRIATTAALTAGTRTLDANPFMAEASKTLAAAATVQDTRLEATFDTYGAQAHPIILAASEGIVVRSVIAQGAAGTVRWSVSMAWTERAAF